MPVHEVGPLPRAGGVRHLSFWVAHKDGVTTLRMRLLFILSLLSHEQAVYGPAINTGQIARFGPIEAVATGSVDRTSIRMG